MKKVYEIRKFVVARSVKEAFKLEKLVDAEEIIITRHSTDILLDTLHVKHKI
jgi:hypothetical protein